MTEAQEKISSIISRVIELRPMLSETIEKLRNEIAIEEAHYAGRFKYSETYWQLVMYSDALIKLRVLTERNFTYIESFSLLAVTRYLVELSIWIRLLSQDKRYGLLYYRMLIKDSQDYWEHQINQLQREITLLKRFESKEKSEIQQALSHDPNLEALRAILDNIDQEAAELFSVYEDDAQKNGYGFQAFLIEQKALPHARAALNEANAEMKEFDISLAGFIEDIRPQGPWKWEEMAKRSDMKDEYDFIYSYTSRMLHAKPFNLTTDQKSLEDIEVYLFLRYCLVKIVEALQLVRGQLHTSTLH